MGKIWINPAFKDKIPELKNEEKPVIKEQVKAEKKKENSEVKRERKVDNSIIQITEFVILRLKERGTNTDKIIDLVNKDFTKDSLKEELKKREIPNEDINKIVCCVKESKPASTKSVVKSSIEYKLFKYFIDNQIPIEARLINGITFTGRIKWFSDGLIALAVDGKSEAIVLHRFMIVSYTPVMEKSLSETEIKELPPVDITGIEIKIMQQYHDSKTPLLFHMLGGMEITGFIDWYEKLVCHIRSLDEKTEYTIYRGSMLYFEELV